jgi:hypothetical protein
MKPVEIPNANIVLRRPASMSAEQCGDLHAHFDGRTFMSEWELSEEELQAVIKSRRVRVWVWAGVHPPIALGAVGPQPEPGAPAP